MKAGVLIDAYQLTQWMNARKLTPELVSARAGLPRSELLSVLGGKRAALPDEVALQLAASLEVTPDQIAGQGLHDVCAVTVTGDELRASRRPIQRDGIHFYNYYSMAGRPGQVAPVVLDILCPQDCLPALNNGHLEPAITVNLGPGDIHGRWGEELDEATWGVLEANRGAEGWITGDSYVEPSFCPHSYSLCSRTPARIVSYTAESQLAPLIKEINDWPDHAFAALLELLPEASPAQVLRVELRRRCHTVESAAQSTGVPAHALGAFVCGDGEALQPEERRRLARGLGFDHRVLEASLPPHDGVGKTSCTIAQSRSSVRGYASYRVASMAMAPRLPDLTGQFVEVTSRASEPALDLWSLTDTHYLVIAGELTLTWAERSGVAARRLSTNASAWVAPCIAHSWTGEGGVLRFGSGRHVSSLEALELSNTFAAAETLRRGRRSVVGWGYDGDGDA